jgi:hypothetical protein
VLLVPLAVSRDGFHLAPFVALACFGSVYLLAPMLRQSGRLQVLLALVTLVAVRLYFFALPLQLGGESELAASLRPETQVTRASAPTDPILYLPIAPQGYLADERQPGSFYTHFLPWTAAIPGAEERVIADIERNRVMVIVLDQEARIWDRYRFGEYAPRLHAHILASYRPLDHRDSKRARLFVRSAPWS